MFHGSHSNCAVYTQAKREVGDLQEQLKELQADIEKSRSVIRLLHCLPTLPHNNNNNRDLLISSVAGAGSGKRFKNLKLGDLVRIRLKQDDGKRQATTPPIYSGQLKLTTRTLALPLVPLFVRSGTLSRALASLRSVVTWRGWRRRRRCR